MTTQITLPNLGENIESGDVLSILVSEGDTISADQDLLEIETDKATMPVPSPEAGKVVKILVSEGDTLAVGAGILSSHCQYASTSTFVPGFIETIEISFGPDLAHIQSWSRSRRGRFDIRVTDRFANH